MANATLLCCLVFAFFAFCITETRAGQWCYNYYTSYSLNYEYCSFGCCGSYNNKYCCGASVGLIIGCVIAGIIVICIVVALICCCMKKQSHAGRVVQPANGPRPAANVTVVHAGTSGPYSGPQPMGPVPPMQPPPYKQFNSVPPPAYNYSNPAYPPGAAAYPPPSAAFPPPSAANAPPSAAFPPPSAAFPPPGPANSAAFAPPPPGFNVNGPPNANPNP